MNDLVSRILYEFFENVKQAAAEGQRSLEALSDDIARKIPAEKTKNIITLLTGDPDFQKLVYQLNEEKGINAAIIIAAATFPAEKFLTVRALTERMIELGFIPEKFYSRKSDFAFSVMQITGRLKRNYAYGDGGKHIPIKAPMDSLRIDWSKPESKNIIDAKHVKTSQLKSPQYALRLNQTGRTKAIEIVKTLGFVHNINLNLILGSGAKPMY